MPVERLLLVVGGNLRAEHGRSNPEVLGRALCEEGFGLGSVEYCVRVLYLYLRMGFYSLADLLTPVGAQLGCAGAHNGIGRRDVSLLASETQLPLVNRPHHMHKNRRIGWGLTGFPQS